MWYWKQHNIILQTLRKNTLCTQKPVYIFKGRSLYCTPVPLLRQIIWYSDIISDGLPLTWRRSTVDLHTILMGLTVDRTFLGKRPNTKNYLQQFYGWPWQKWNKTHFKELPYTCKKVQWYHLYILHLCMFMTSFLEKKNAIRYGRSCGLP